MTKTKAALLCASYKAALVGASLIESTLLGTGLGLVSALRAAFSTPLDLREIAMMVLRRLSVFVLVLILAGCAGRTQLESDLKVRGAPDWVNKGTAYVDDKGGRLFHGVGSAGFAGDDALQRAIADDRARAEVARIFSSYLDVASRDYQAASRSGESQSSEEAVARQIRALSKVNLSGAKIVARWFDARSKAVYSIAELDVKHVKDILAAARDMNEDLRGYLNANAENLFDRISHGRK